MAEVPTARGTSIDSSALGFTLPVETIFLITSSEVDVNWPELSFGAVPESERIADAVAKLTVAKRHGVDTIVDRTLPGIGRDVRRIKRIAEQVDVNIVVCTGWYTWNDLPFFFAFGPAAVGAPATSRPSLEEIMVRDLEIGIGSTGVRAGLIKFATDRHGLTDGVTEVIRSSARAHRRTGAPITTHTGIGLGVSSALLQQQVLESEGVDQSRVHYGHLDFSAPDAPLDDFKRLLDSGAFGSFDTASTGTGRRPEFAKARIERIVALCEAGYTDQLMLSGDSACWQDLFPEDHPAMADPGLPPFTQVTLELVPALLERGVSPVQIEQMTVHNPRRLLETRAFGAY